MMHGKNTPSPLIERLQENFRKFGHNLAVIDRNVSFTYEQLDNLSDVLANELKKLDPPVVGLYMARSALAVLAAVAAAKAGVAYVPMGLDWPDARCALIAEQCHLGGVLGAKRDLEGRSWADGIPHVDPADFTDFSSAKHADVSLPSPCADAILYIMHTSGSTGVPKGVLVHHAGIHDIFTSVAHLGYVPGEHMVHVATLTFDMSIMELWGGLLNGCTLHVADTETILDATALLEFLRSNAIGFLILPTSVFNVLCSQNPEVFRPLRNLCFGGELPSGAVIRTVLDACPELGLHNCYGPTECTVFVAAHSFGHSEETGPRIPTGKALGTAHFLIMDDNGAHLPPGNEGELVISGICVANGYVRSPAGRASFHVLSDGSRAYSTGDRALIDENGTLYVLGRNDDQVKISGCRVEPGEVLAALQESDLVRMAYVYARRNPTTALVAYVVPSAGAGDRSTLAARLADFMSTRVPGYMIPGHFVFLAELPLNSNGKVDRTRLPLPKEEVAPPPDPVLAVFRTVLENARYMPEDSFLEAGGTSIMAARLVAALRELSGVSVPFSLILEPQTANRVGLYIENVRLGQRQHSKGHVAARI